MAFVTWANDDDDCHTVKGVGEAINVTQISLPIQNILKQSFSILRIFCADNKIRGGNRRLAALKSEGEADNADCYICQRKR